jgi:hypothetical protein
LIEPDLTALLPGFGTVFAGKGLEALDEARR